MQKRDARVARRELRQQGERLRIRRAVVHEQQLPVFVHLRDNRADGLFKPLRRSVKNRRNDADEGLMMKLPRIAAQSAHVRSGNAMALKPPLVFGCRIRRRNFLKLPAALAANMTECFLRQAIGREQHLADPALGTLPQRLLVSF